MTTTPNTLVIPFRASAHVSFNDAIRQYINHQYDQRPDMFLSDLTAIDTLRRSAITAREAHVSCILRLQSYAAQLVWLNGKFPIDIGVEFPWYPAFHPPTNPILRDNLRYELLNILSNLVALYAHLADSTSRSTPTGLKTAASYFSLAAGTLAHMRLEILPTLRMSNIPDDLDAATLHGLELLCLAEAQECFWQKAVTDGYKDGVIAKLAARVAELYGAAAEKSTGGDGVPSEWIKHMWAKRWHFGAAAQYRAAADCLEKRKYGEEVARLREALNCVNEGLKVTKGSLVNKGVIGDLNGIKKRIEADIKRAERDNDVIYLQNVPTKSELKVIDTVNMASPKCPSEVSNPLAHLSEKTAFGPPLFSNLVPFSVHLAVSIYEERRDRIVNKEIIEPLDEMTETLNAMLDSLGLPGSLQALEKPLGLPPSLIQRAEEVRQAGAVERVEDCLRDVESLKGNDLAVFEEGKQLILRELEDDERIRRVYGEAWTRLASKEDETGKKLWTRMAEIEKYLRDSTASDKLVRDKFEMIKGPLSILCGSDRALHDYVPATRRQEIPEGLRMILGKLRSAYNDIQRLQSRRRKRIELIREKARDDDPRDALRHEAACMERENPGISLSAATFDDFIERRLTSLYDPEQAAVDNDETEQARISAEITRIAREFESQKRIHGNKEGREREEVLQRLNGAYERYREILEGAEAGRKFYNDLRRIVDSMFTDVAKGWANDRRLEAEAMKEEILLPPLARARISSPPIQQQQPQQQQQQYQTLAPIQTVPQPHTQQIYSSSPTEEFAPENYSASKPAPAPIPLSHTVPSPLIQEPDLLHEVSVLTMADTTVYEDPVSSLPEVPQEDPEPSPQRDRETREIPERLPSVPMGVPAAARQNSSRDPILAIQGMIEQAQAQAQGQVPGLVPTTEIPRVRTAWTPDMGIQFQALPGVPTGQPQSSAQRNPSLQRKVWDPAAGIKFS